ncbi:uncharacterized protein [Chamaea fasciata]|uniref:uncharacterized protein n=1 Tax=Chamaea fasciata TaxID=190680 RepID=UPI00336A2A84
MLNKAMATGPAWLLALPLSCFVTSGSGPRGHSQLDLAHPTSLILPVPTCPFSQDPQEVTPPRGGSVVELERGHSHCPSATTSREVPSCRGYRETESHSAAHSTASGPAGKAPQQPWRRAVPRGIPGARMPSLPQDSPAAGLGTGFPLVRGPPSELMGFYTTTYEVAFGKRPVGSPQKFQGGRVLGVEPPSDRSLHPLLGVHASSGYVTNNYSALSSIIFPRVERQDTDVSSTSEDFKLFGHPDFQRMLPQHVDEPECWYPMGFSLSRLRFGEVRAPKASTEYGTWSCHATPAQPDVPQRATELSAFTGTAPRSDLSLPEQPLSPDPAECPVPPPLHPPGDTFALPRVGDSQMDSFHAICSAPQPAMGYPAPFAPQELQVGPKGVTTEKEPLTYGTVQNQYLTKFSPMAPIAPGWWAQTPITWAPRSVEGVQIPSPSGFSTNNHPTNLWRIDDPPT